MNFRLLSSNCNRIASDSKLWISLAYSSKKYTRRTFCYSRKQVINCFTNDGNVNIPRIEHNRIFDEITSFPKNINTYTELWSNIQKYHLIYKDRKKIITSIQKCSTDRHLLLLITALVERFKISPDEYILYNLLCSSPIGFYKVITSIVNWKEKCQNFIDYNPGCGCPTIACSPFCFHCRFNMDNTMCGMITRTMVNHYSVPLQGFGKMDNVNVYKHLWTNHLVIPQDDTFLVLGKWYRNKCIDLTENEKEDVISIGFIIDHTVCRANIIKCQLPLPEDVVKELDHCFQSEKYIFMFCHGQD